MYGSSRKARGDIQKVLLSLVLFSKKPSYLRQELSQETIEKFSWGPMLDYIEACHAATDGCGQSRSYIYNTKWKTAEVMFTYKGK